MVLDGLGPDMASLIKYWTARSTAKKYGPGWSGLGYGQFDRGLESEIREVFAWETLFPKILGFFCYFLCFTEIHFFAADCFRIVFWTFRTCRSIDSAHVTNAWFVVFVALRRQSLAWCRLLQFCGAIFYIWRHPWNTFSNLLPRNCFNHRLWFDVTSCKIDNNTSLDVVFSNRFFMVSCVNKSVSGCGWNAFGVVFDIDSAPQAFPNALRLDCFGNCLF